jgi:hypothetical protein
MSDYTVKLEGLELFVALIKKGNLPHQAVESMIENDQDLSTTRLYLKSMLNQITNEIHYKGKV